VVEDIIVEAGAKTELDHIKSTSDVYQLNDSTEIYQYNATQSTSVDYHRNVYAAYLSSTFKIFKFLDMKAGFRSEYTEANANFSNTGNVNMKTLQHPHTLFSGFTYILKESNNKIGILSSH